MKNELQSTVKELLDFVLKKSEVKEAEAYASNNKIWVYRLAYHSSIPSNGLEEPKSDETMGISTRILFKDGSYGFGSSDSDFTRSGFKEAFEKARESKVKDPYFHGFPEPVKIQGTKILADKKTLELEEEKGIEKAYEILEGAFSTLKEKDFHEGANLTGELDVVSTRMAVTNSLGVIASEENSHCTSTLTTVLESKKEASGTGFESGTSIGKLEAEKAGRNAVEKAFLAKNTKKIPGGDYKVVLSESAISELFYSRFDTALSSIDYHASMFAEKLDEKMGVEEFNVDDNPLLEGAIGSKQFTDEGLPTSKTTIIQNGVLKNYLSNYYYSNKKKEWGKFAPKNGFRGATRNYFSDVGILGTNIVVKKGNCSEEELLKEVKNGILVGRLWYTYPINGYSSPDFTSTIRGDSFIIKNGEIAGALQPNSMRVMESFDRFMKNITAIGKTQKAIQAWGQDETIVTPKIALKSFRLKRISTP